MNIEIIKTDGNIEKKTIKESEFLKEAQQAVGGYYRVVPPYTLNPVYQKEFCTNHVVIANEDGESLRLRQNPYIQDLVGDVMLVKKEDYFNMS